MERYIDVLLGHHEGCPVVATRLCQCAGLYVVGDEERSPWIFPAPQDLPAIKAGARRAIARRRDYYCAGGTSLMFVSYRAFQRPFTFLNTVRDVP